MQIKTVLQSNALLGFLCGIGVVIVLLFVFFIGLIIGYDRANAHCAWGGHGMMGFPPGPGFAFDPHHEFNAHGVMGTVTSTTTNQFVVKTIDGTSRTVNYTADTRIEKNQTAGTTGDIVVDAKVMIFGDTQSDGTVSATIVHLFTDFPPLPPPPTNMMPSAL